MRLVADLDAGPVCAMEATKIAPTDDYGMLAARLAATAALLLIEVLGRPRAYIPQSDEGVTYAEKITAEDRVLDPTRTAAELERTVRALHPHIGARTAAGLGVQKARVAGEEAAAAGELLVRDGRLLYGAADEPLELLRVKPAGGREMDAADYIRGHAL